MCVIGEDLGIVPRGFSRACLVLLLLSPRFHAGNVVWFLKCSGRGSQGLGGSNWQGRQHGSLTAVLQVCMRVPRRMQPGPGMEASTRVLLGLRPLRTNHITNPKTHRHTAATLEVLPDAMPQKQQAKERKASVKPSLKPWRLQLWQVTRNVLLFNGIWMGVVFMINSVVSRYTDLGLRLGDRGNRWELPL